MELSAETNDLQNTPARPGTALYYSLLYTDPAARSRAISTLAFIRAISTTLYDVNEPQVAEKKIHWWHEELARLAKRSARHPACIGVQDFLHTNDSLKASLKVLSAAATEKYSPIKTEQDLHEILSEDYGARLTLFNNALKAVDTSDAGTVENSSSRPITFHPKSTIVELNSQGDTNDAIAVGLGQFIRLNSLVERIRRGYPVFSDERYQAYNLSPDDLLNRRSDNPDKSSKKLSEINDLLTHSINQTHIAIEQSLTSIALNGGSNQTSLPVLIMCQIRSAQLKLWNKSTPDLLNESVSLTPVRKFIIAYRCNRRFRKDA